MGFKYNVFTGNLDITGGSSIGTGNFVTYVGASSDVNLGTHILSANTLIGAVTANTLTVDALNGPLIANAGVVSAASTGNLTASSPLSVSGTRQLLGGAADLSIDTSNLQAVITTGVISVVTPLSTNNLAYAVGNSLEISINTANLVPYVGATSALLLGANALSTNTLMAGNTTINVLFVNYATMNALSVTTVNANFLTAGNLDVSGRIRTNDTGADPASGSGIELLYIPGAKDGYIICYDRTASAYRDLIISGSSLNLVAESTIAVTGNVRAGNIFATSVSANVVTANAMKLGTLAGPLTGTAGLISALTTGNLTVTAPLQTDNTRQILGGSVALSINTQSTLVISAITANKISCSEDIYTAPWTNYSSTSHIIGWASFTTQEVFYKKIGRLVYVHFYYQILSMNQISVLNLSLCH
jgi:hypothetical protein